MIHSLTEIVYTFSSKCPDIAISLIYSLNLTGVLGELGGLVSILWPEKNLVDAIPF